MPQESQELIVPIIATILGLFLIYNTFYIVRQRTGVVIERFGKFQRVARSGIHLKIPLVDQKVTTLNMRVMELPVEVETKTKDDVFVRMIISVQYYIVDTGEGIKDAYYKLDHPGRQIQSYVFDSIRSEVPRMELDDVFSEKDKIALAVQSELSDTMRQFGYDIIKALVTDIDPDAKVKHSMNEINAAKRMKEAAKEYAAAEKIKVVAAAEAEAESKKLQGEGIANQRIAIANGMKESVEEVRTAMDAGVSSREVMNMLFLTQHYDTISRLGESGVNTLFIPYSPDSVGDLQMQIQSSILATESMKSGGDYEPKPKKGPSNEE